MGLDIKAAMDGIVAVVSQNYPYLLAGLLLLLLFGSNRVRDGIYKALTDSWQLTLLASTGIALSLASAYTTFDGLRNFTERAAAFGIYILRHSGRDADRRLAHRRELCRRHEPARCRRPAHAPGRRQSSAWCSGWRSWDWPSTGCCTSSTP